MSTCLFNFVVVVVVVVVVWGGRGLVMCACMRVCGCG